MSTAMLTEPMAKKSAKKPGSTRKGSGDTAGRKPMVVQIRGSEEYKAWVEDVARSEGFSVSVLFDQALRRYAAAKYPAPPER